MAGEIVFSIPVTFASLPSPALMSQLDQCFAAIQTALSGVAISAAGVTSNQQGTYEVRGLRGTNNAGTPNTQYDIAADAVGLRNPATGAITATTSFSATCNLLTSGPAANGRDQAGAFSGSSWIHFYIIGSDSGGPAAATLASLTAPPTGPTLPNGYSYWSYAGAVRYNATPLLVTTLLRGNTAYYVGVQTALSDGRAAVETAIDLSTFMPPNAAASLLFVRSFAGPGNPLDLRLVAGTDYIQVGTNSGSTNQDAWQGAFPNLTQQILYQWSIDPTAGFGLDVFVNGYVMPNGA